MRSILFVVVGCVLLMGCAERGESPTSAEPAASGFELQTTLGPVRVLSVTDSSDGVRELQVDAVRGNGTHDVRRIRIQGHELDDRPGFFEFTYSVRDRKEETFRITRVSPEDGAGYVEITQAAEGQELVLRVKAVGGENAISVERAANGVVKRAFHELDPTRLDDAAYVETIARSLERVYRGSPFENNPERDLMMAVVTSSDWNRYLEEADPATGIDDTEENFIRVCVAAAAVSRVACFAAQLVPWAWVACVPATGISIACLAYEVQAVFLNDDAEGTGCRDGYVCPNGDS